MSLPPSLILSLTLCLSVSLSFSLDISLSFSLFPSFSLWLFLCLLLSLSLLPSHYVIVYILPLLRINSSTTISDRTSMSIQYVKYVEVRIRIVRYCTVPTRESSLIGTPYVRYRYRYTLHNIVSALL